MREIVFRGKHKASGKWCEGNLHVDKQGVAIITPDDTPLGCYGQVDPDTVGQYTGLTDKDGRKVFEGDIVSAHFDWNDPEAESKAIVEWDNDNFRWVTHQPGYDPDAITDFDKGLWLVIGNVHDNPELMNK